MAEPLSVQLSEMQPVPFGDALSNRVQEITSLYRKEWDERTPAVGREWYLRREAGLCAYARYAANLWLKPCNRHSRSLTGNKVWPCHDAKARNSVDYIRPVSI